MKCRTCGRDTNPEITGAICETCWDTATPAELELVASPSFTADVIMWRRAAAHDALSPALARRLAWVEDLDTLAGLAANPNTPEQILELLRQHPTPVVARLAAQARPASQTEAPDPPDALSPPPAAAAESEGLSDDDLDAMLAPKQGFQRWLPLGIVAGSFLLLVVVVLMVTGGSSGDAEATTTSSTSTTTTTVASTTTTTAPAPIELVGGILPPPTGPLTEKRGAVARVADKLTAPDPPIKIDGEPTWQWQLCPKPAKDEPARCEDLDGETDEKVVVPNGTKPDAKLRVQLTVRPADSDRDITMSSRQVKVVKK